MAQGNGILPATLISLALWALILLMLIGVLDYLFG